MYILKKYKILLIGLLFCMFACNPSGPLTPEENFNMLVTAYQNKDGNMLKKLITKKSVDQLQALTASFNKLPDQQLKSLAYNWNIPAESLKKMSLEDFLKLQIILGEKSGSDSLNNITKYKLISVQQDKDVAIIHLENNVNLKFFREGPYWKFDLISF